MASEDATVHHILGLLDRHSFKTLERAVQQFKDHKQRFHESLFELKSLKPPQAGDCPIMCGAKAPLPSLGMQMRCRPLKPPVDAICEQEDIENHGGKQYALRPRAPRKLSTVAVPQRMTRSRAKQSVTTTAAACSVPSETEFMALEGDFVEARAKGNPKTEEHQQASFQNETPAEAAISRFAEASAKGNPENQHHQQTSSQVVIAGTSRSVGKESLTCKETPSGIKSSRDPDKRRSSGTVPGIGRQGMGSIEHFKPFSQQNPISGEDISGTFWQSSGKGNKGQLLHTNNELPLLGTCIRFDATHLMGTGAATLARSPTEHLPSSTSEEHDPRKTIDAVQSKGKQEKQSSFNAEDGPCGTCLKKDCIGSLQHSPIALKHSPQQSDSKVGKPISEEFHGTDFSLPILSAGKRKLSVYAGFACGVDTKDMPDGPCGTCFKKDCIGSLQHSPIALKHSPQQSDSKVGKPISQEFHGTDFSLPILSAGKRKLSVYAGFACGVDTNDYHVARNWIATSRSSTELEAFKFDSDEETFFSESSKLFKSVASLYYDANGEHPCAENIFDQAPRFASRQVSIHGGEDDLSVANKEFSKGRVEPGLKGLGDFVASDGLCGSLSQASCKAGGNRVDSSEKGSQGYTPKSVLKGIHKGTPERQHSFQLTEQEIHQSNEKMDVRTNMEDTHTQMMNHDDRSTCSKEQCNSALKITCADKTRASVTDVSDVCHSARLQPKSVREMSLETKSDLESANCGPLYLFSAMKQHATRMQTETMEPCMCQFAEQQLAFSFKTSIPPTEGLASENTAAELNDLPQLENTVAKVVLSCTWEKSKDDVFDSPKVQVDCMSLSPGMRRPSALNNVEQMKESNPLFSASKSSWRVKCHSVESVALLSSSEFAPNPNMEGKLPSSSVIPFALASPTEKKKVAADTVLDNTDTGSHTLLSLGFEPAKVCKKIRNSLHLPVMDMEAAPATQLGCTSEPAVVLILSMRDSSCKDNIESPRQPKFATKAPESQHEAWKTEMRSLSRPSYTKASNDCGLTRKSSTLENNNLFLAQAPDFEDHNMERSKKTVSLGMNPSAHIHFLTPMRSEARATKLSNSSGEEIISSMMPALHSQVKKNERHMEIDSKKSSSQIIDCGPSPRPELEQKEKGTSRNASLDLPSPRVPKYDSSVKSPMHVQDRETNKRTAYKSDDHNNISTTSSQMDCSESSSPSCRPEKGKSDNLQREKEGCTTEWNFTPKDDHSVHGGRIHVDEEVLRFNQLLAEGTVNSSRRKRARSPADLSVESYNCFKKMKLSMNENDGQNVGESLSHTFLPYGLPRPSFGESDSPSYGLVKIPHLFSPVQGLRDTSGNHFPCSKGLINKRLGFDSAQRQIKGRNKLCNSYSGVSCLGREYLDTPHFRSARADLVDRNSAKSRKQKSDLHLDTHTEEDGKENQTPNPWLIDKNCSATGILLENQGTAKARKILGYVNQPLGLVESSHKRYNLAVDTSSFLDLVQQKQVPLPYPNGKREVRVKALEAAELAKRQEERREYERKMRRLECNEAKSTESECLKDKMQQSCASTIAGKGVSDKVKRVAELKMKMDQEKARKQEEEQRRKEEERKKKEAGLAYRKRKREDADRREREEKRKRVEEVQRLRKEQEERQRLELDEKEHKRRVLEVRERERKAQEEESKRQQRIEKEKKAEHRRKQEQESKASRFAEKQAERKRKEAMLQARGHEDDHIAQHASGKKLSELSTDSLAVGTSADWDVQFRSIVPTRSQTLAEERWGLSAPHLESSMHILGKLSTSASLDENEPHCSAKQVFNESSFKCEATKGLRSHYSTPFNAAYAPAQPANLESGFQSYEISPYRSSSDEEDEDEDDKRQKPIPLWARKENLVPQIVWQQCIDPDEIFLSDKTCSLAEIFGTTGSRKCKNFKQRSTSGDWLEDHATWKEELDYKKTMGYI